MSNFFTPIMNIRRRRTRAADNNIVMVPRVKSGSCSKAYSYCGPVFWNTLDVATRAVENSNEFKGTISQASAVGNQNMPT